MKIAVCYSGVLRGNYNKNIALLRQLLPGADFFYTAWKNSKQEDFIHYYDEPVMHYNPALSNIESYPKTYSRFIRSQAKMDAWKHRSKQILGHAICVEKHASNYDIIIRARYDAEPLFDSETLINFIQQSYKNNQSIGFFIPRAQKIFNNIIEPMALNSDRHLQHLVDHLIIHPRYIFDIKQVWDLHKQSKLLIAEYGWWQVLNNKNTHLCFKGMIKLD